MEKPVMYLLTFLILIGFIAYAYGVFKACYLSWPQPHHGHQYSIPSFLSTTVTSIAAVLSTNIGAVLGITITQPNSKFNEIMAWNPLLIFAGPTATGIQILACYVYILSLVAAAIVWAHRNFEASPDKIVPLVAELTKSLVGIIVGALAISMNLHNL